MKKKVKVRKFWNVVPVTKVDKVKKKYSRSQSKRQLKRELTKWEEQ